MSLIDLIKRRTHIVNQKSEGINLAIYLINEFQDRTFSFKGLKNKYCEPRRENLLKLIQEELDSMLILYSYTTRVKTYTDRKGVSQLKIRLIGKAGMKDRYNPLDIELDITTEKPIRHHIMCDRALATIILTFLETTKATVFVFQNVLIATGNIFSL